MPARAQPSDFSVLLLRTAAIIATVAFAPACGDDAPSSPGTAGPGGTAGSVATTGGGGSAAGATSGAGGSTSAGGTNTVGGSPTGGSAGSAGAGLGGSTGGGAAGGGSGGTGGATQTCDLPSELSWTSSQPLITPKSPAGRNFVSIKDPTIVEYEGAYHVFATVFDNAASGQGWSSVYLTFSDWAEADAAPQLHMATLPTGGTVAPQVFYFTPHQKWYLIYQWGARYSTNDDIENPQGWSTPQPLLEGEPSGALDYWVICDDANCHLFFARDDGTLYRSKVAKEDFPNFSGYETVMSDSVADLFEAPNVYKVDGTDKYLLMVEAYGPRYFRSWTSDSLDGPWTELAATQQEPFAGAANVTFDGPDWSDDVSHGELLRSGHDERLTINACKLQFLYQGLDPSASGDYGLLPYKLGLLTAN